MQLSMERRGDVDVLTVDGSISAEDNAAFSAAMAGLTDEGRFRLVIDASELGYLNSRGIGEVVQFVQKARLKGGKVVFVRPCERVEKIMKAVGLYSLVQSFETLEEAVDACGP